MTKLEVTDINVGIMAVIKLKGNPIHTSGTLPGVGSQAPNFSLVRQDLSEVTLSTFDGKRKVLNIFPSLDTSVCANTVHHFHEKIPNTDQVIVLNISKDLPFAHERFCGTKGLLHVETLSAFRSTFATDYGLEIIDGPLASLCSRVVIVLDENNNILYTEQVPEITEEPNYDEVLKVLLP